MYDQHVAPIFYYNSTLGELGEEMGLNLFEPRYVLMCSRIAQGLSPPVILFIPNFVDYCARPGDTAYEIQVTHLQQRRDGTFGFRGVIARLAVLELHWQEPSTQGLSVGLYTPYPSTQVSPPLSASKGSHSSADGGADGIPFPPSLPVYFPTPFYFACFRCMLR